jgi:hypothetical protein
VLKLRRTPRLCSILAIVNVGSPVRGAGFSGVAVNALRKDRASNLSRNIRVSIETKINLVAERAHLKRDRRGAAWMSK